MRHQFITKKHICVAVAFFISIIIFFSFNARVIYASTTDGTMVSGGNNGYAWSDKAGWVNFGISNGNIHITDSGITGYAWNANYGWINMSPTNGGITISSAGALSGSVWGSGLGWIDFSGVSINSSGKFVGTASGSGIGTLTFDCDNCSVVTDYRPQDFRTTTTPLSGGGGGGGGGGVIQQSPPVTTPTEVLPPDGAGTGQATPFDTVDTESQSESEDLLPAQLFDIRLILDRVTITRIADLVARVTFTSFGRVPTPVDMTFSILDADGKEILKNVDTTTVQTEAVFVKRFLSATELSPGAYILRLHTTYNKDVEDTFEAKFTVSPAASPSYWILWFIGGLTLLILVILFFIWRKRRQDAGNSTARPYQNYDNE